MEGSEQFTLSLPKPCKLYTTADCDDTPRRSIGREMRMFEILECIYDKNMIHVDLGLLYFHNQGPGFVTSVLCAGRELPLVEDWRRIATSTVGVFSKKVIFSVKHLKIGVS